MIFLRFLAEVFRGTAGVVGVLAGTVSLAVGFYPLDAEHIALRPFIISILIVSVFAVIFMLRSFQFYSAPRRRIEIIRMFAGDGLYSGRTLFELENPSTLREGALLTVYFSSSNRPPMQRGIIQVTRCLEGENVVAASFPPAAATDLSLYADDQEIRGKRLFASPLVQADDLQFVLNLAPDADSPALSPAASR